MAYLVVAVGIGCLANLALTLRLARRLRQLSARSLTFGPRPASRRLPVGGQARDFTAATVAGETRTLAQLTRARSVVAFFSLNCAACRVELPEFARYASRVPGGTDRVLAVISGQGDPGDFTRELAGIASVVTEPMAGGPVAVAFYVSGYPTFYVLDEAGRVEASGPRVLDIAAQPV